MSPPLLVAEGLRATIGGSEILRGVSVTVSPGQIVGVLGPSGAGKSTLFRVLVGELRPSAGEVRLLGEPVTRLPLWRRARLGLGYVPQTPSVLFDLSVAENIRTFERAAGARVEPIAERAARVGLEDRLDVRAGDLSGGERRRLELLRALIGQPHLLVCDEPLTGVDPVGAARLAELLRGCAALGMGIILADHRVREALKICDSALLLVDGEVALVEKPEQFADHPAVRQRYLG